MINVLVIFECSSGMTETLALAAAVGAVQARANIRMRRLPDDSAEMNETLARMRREYVAPMPADALWADAVIIAKNGKVCGIVIIPWMQRPLAGKSPSGPGQSKNPI